MKLATPLRAIRLKCYDCSCWQWNEVKNCVQSDCILWPYRLGKRPKGMKPQRVESSWYAKVVSKR